MRYLIIFLFPVLMNLYPCHAEAESPHWSFGVRGGYFEPEIDDWGDYYDHDGYALFGAEIGWKPFRQFEINVNVHYSYTEGNAATVTGRKSGDEITYQSIPVHVSLLYRLVFRETQLFVPYAGGGYSHIFYRTKIDGERTTGDQKGYHVRGGVQFLLNPLEPDNARELLTLWGIDNSYLFLEGMFSSVDDFGDKEDDLGGTALFAGILLEF